MEFSKIGNNIKIASDDWAFSQAQLSKDGSTVAISAPYTDANGVDSGKVTIFSYDKASKDWKQVGNEITGLNTYSKSGISLDLSSDGSILAVGSTATDKNGHIQVFEKNNNEWTQIGEKIVGEATDDNVGVAVKLSGDGSIVAIGAPLNDGNGTNSGHVRIFERVNKTWIQIGDDIDGEATGDLSGSSIVLSEDGKSVAIGARKNDGLNGTDSGHIRVFDYVPLLKKWIQKGDDIEGQASFSSSGSSISLSKDADIIAFGEPVVNDYKGQTRVFEYNYLSKKWEQIGATIQGGAINDWSGYSISLSGDGETLIVGDYLTESWSTEEGSYARIFTYEEGQKLWIQKGLKINSSGRSVDISLEGNVFAIEDAGYYKIYFDNDYSPLINGPTGDDGSSSSSENINENTKNVFSFTANQTATWSISGGADQSLFEINAISGKLSFINAPDYEKPSDSNKDNVYEVNVKATNNVDISSSQLVSIGVLNVVEFEDEDGLTSTISIDENISKVHTFVADEISTWSITGGLDSSLFEINTQKSQYGDLSFINPPDFENPLDSNKDNNYQVFVRATDNAGNKANQIIIVKIIDVDDTPPLITGPSGEAGSSTSGISIYENNPNIFNFDANEIVTWSLYGGIDSDLFLIDSNTGNLSFLNAPDYENPLDSGKDNNYQVVIRATDVAGNTSNQTIAIEILNLVEINNGEETLSISIKENTTNVFTFKADETVTWSLNGGKDQGFFTISSATGTLSFITAPDFEKPSDNDKNNIYQVEVKATDQSGNTASQQIKVTVLDDDDVPAITPIVPYDGSVEAQSTDQEISNSDKTYVTSKTSVIFNGKSEVIDINRGKVSSGNSFYIKELTNEAKNNSPTGVSLNSSVIEVSLQTPQSNSNSGTSTALVFSTDLVANSLSLINDLGIRDSKIKLTYNSIDGNGLVTDLQYNSILGGGARFYDLIGNDGVADTVHLVLIDGGYGDRENGANENSIPNGTIEDPSTAGTVLLDPVFKKINDNVLQLTDTLNSSSSANSLIRVSVDQTTLTNTSDEIGFALLQKNNDGVLESPTLPILRSRSQILFNTLENKDRTLIPTSENLFVSDILLGNNQGIVLYQVTDGNISEVTSTSDTNFNFFELNQTIENQAELITSNGLKITLDELNVDQGLNDMIGQNQSISPVLDFSALPSNLGNIKASIEVAREAIYDSTISFYKVINTSGSVVDSVTGNVIDANNPNYAKYALANDNIVSNFSSFRVDNNTTNTITLDNIKENSLIAPYALVNDQTFFAFGDANNDSINHIKTLGNNVFGLEDLVGGGDNDFDDLIVSFDFSI